MSEAIYIQHGQALTRMELTTYSCEDDFQTLLESYSDLLAGDQVNPESPRRWLLIKREAGSMSSFWREKSDPLKWRKALNQRLLP